MSEIKNIICSCKILGKKRKLKFLVIILIIGGLLIGELE